MVAKRTIFFNISKLGSRRVNSVGMINMNIKYCKQGYFCLDGGDHIDYHNAYDTYDAFCATLFPQVHA